MRVRYDGGGASIPDEREAHCAHGFAHSGSEVLAITNPVHDGEQEQFGSAEQSISSGPGPKESGQQGPGLPSISVQLEQHSMPFQAEFSAMH